MTRNKSTNNEYCYGEMSAGCRFNLTDRFIRTNKPVQGRLPYTNRQQKEKDCRSELLYEKVSDPVCGLKRGSQNASEELLDRLRPLFM